MLRKSFVCAFALAFALVIAACAPAATPAPTSAPAAVPTSAPTSAPAQPTAVPTTAAPSPTVVPTQAPASPTTAAMQVTDSAGRKVAVVPNPQRIVSLAPSNTEILSALGLGKQVVGVDEFSDYPEAAKSLPKVSKGFQYNYEQIVALKPDLILAAGITAPDAIKKLEELKLPVAVIGSVNTQLKDVYDQIQLVGQLSGHVDQAKSITSAMQTRVDAVKAQVAKTTTRPRVFWELDATDPAKPYAPGPGSFIDEIINLAGGTNVAASSKSAYAQLSAEEIVRANPQVIILSDAAYGTTPDSVLKRPGWNAIDAVKNKQVYPIDDNLVSRPGPRVVDGLEAAVKLIHPELSKAYP